MSIIKVIEREIPNIIKFLLIDTKSSDIRPTFLNLIWVRITKAFARAYLKLKSIKLMVTSCGAPIILD